MLTKYQVFSPKFVNFSNVLKSSNALHCVQKALENYMLTMLAIALTLMKNVCAHLCRKFISMCSLGAPIIVCSPPSIKE